MKWLRLLTAPSLALGFALTAGADAGFLRGVQ